MLFEVGKGLGAYRISRGGISPIELTGRTNYKLIDTNNVGSKNLSVGIVSVHPGSRCEPGDHHFDQEEVLFGLSGKGKVLLAQAGGASGRPADPTGAGIEIEAKIEVETKTEVEMGVGDAVFVSPGTHHMLDNPNDEPFEVLWILSPAGWCLERDPWLMARARDGVRV